MQALRLHVCLVVAIVGAACFAQRLIASFFVSLLQEAPYCILNLAYSFIFFFFFFFFFFLCVMDLPFYQYSCSCMFVVQHISMLMQFACLCSFGVLGIFFRWTFCLDCSDNMAWIVILFFFFRPSSILDSRLHTRSSTKMRRAYYMMSTYTAQKYTDGTWIGRSQ